MTQRLSTSSNGRGPALTAVIADWAARNPKIRRVWACETPVAQAVAVALELQPVADSEETSAVWLANCEKWRRQLQSRLHRSVDLEWLDPDEASAPNQPRPAEVRTLIYDRAG
jgi:hypothetical protein